MAGRILIFILISFLSVNIFAAKVLKAKMKCLDDGIIFETESDAKNHLELLLNSTHEIIPIYILEEQ